MSPKQPKITDHLEFRDKNSIGGRQQRSRDIGYEWRGTRWRIGLWQGNRWRGGWGLGSGWHGGWWRGTWWLDKRQGKRELVALELTRKENVPMSWRSAKSSFIILRQKDSNPMLQSGYDVPELQLNIHRDIHNQYALKSILDLSDPILL